MGAQIATRSPGATPLAIRARSMRSTEAATSAKVGRDVPSTTASSVRIPLGGGAQDGGDGVSCHRRSTFEVIGSGTPYRVRRTSCHEGGSCVWVGHWLRRGPFPAWSNAPPSATPGARPWWARPGPSPSTSSWSWCDAAAGALIDAGVGAGDRVALWAPNTPEWAMASLAVLFAGGSVVPVNTRYTAVEAADLVSRAGCRVVLAEGDFGGRSLAREAAAHAGADHRRLARRHDAGLGVVGGASPERARRAPRSTGGWPRSRPATSAMCSTPRARPVRRRVPCSVTAPWWRPRRAGPRWSG